MYVSRMMSAYQSSRFRSLCVAVIGAKPGEIDLFSKVDIYSHPAMSGTSIDQSLATNFVRIRGSNDVLQLGDTHQNG